MALTKNKPKILVIDDDANIRKTLSDILKIKGYEVAAAPDGAQGIKAGQAFYNVALIDLNLPDMLGTEVLEKIKAASPSTEALILTGQASLDSALEAINRGAFSYLIKPYNVEDLLLKINLALERQAARAEIEWLASFPRLNPNGIIEADLSGAVTYMNPAAERLFPDLPSRKAQHPVIAGLKELIFSQEDPSRPITRELNLDGTFYEEHIAYLPGIQRLRLRLFNITERKRAEEAFQLLSHRNELILSALGEGVYGTNLEGKATFVNPAMLQMLGYSQEELIGKKVHPIFHHTRADGSLYPDGECHAYSAFRDGQIHRVSGELFWRKDGTSFFVEYVSTPLLENSKVAGAVVVFKDITESIQKEQELRKSRESLAHAQQIAHIGNWDWDIINNTLLWSDEIYRIFGANPQEFRATYEAFLSFVRPEDRPLVEKAVDEALKEGKPYSIDHSILRRDGSIRIVHEQAEVSYNGDVKPIRMIGTVQDVTEQRILEKELEDFRMEEERLKALHTVSATYAHSILNAVTPLMGYAELIKKSTGPEDPRYKWCQAIIDNTQQAAQTIKKLQQLESFEVTEVGGVEILETSKSGKKKQKSPE